MTYIKALFLFAVVLCAAATGYCQKSDVDEIIGAQLDVYIPNAFTPNFDRLNDVFRPVISGPEIDTYELLILDRTGTEVFSSDDPDRVWDGSTDGGTYLSSPTLFVYFLKVKSVASIETQVFKGHVVMIR